MIDNLSDDWCAEFEHIVLSEEDAIQELRQNELAVSRIAQHYYVEHLIILNSFPKSGSRIVEKSLAILQNAVGKGPGVVTSKCVPASIRKIDPGLRVEMLKYFPDGGGFRHHISPTYNSFHVLALWQCPYILLIRHPADLIAAVYSHLVVSRDHGIWPDNIHPHLLRTLPRLLNAADIEQNDPQSAIQHLLADGYLQALLLWILDWIQFRDMDKSYILRYEDFIQNRMKTLIELTQFLWQTNQVPDEVFLQSQKESDNYAESRKEVIAKYPHGWTGEKNTWKNYFTSENLNTYQLITRRVLEHHRASANLLDLYPDIYLDTL